MKLGIVGSESDPRAAEILVEEPNGGRAHYIRISHLVRIVATPPGEAPEWVRECWRGMLLPVCELGLERHPVLGNSRGVLSGAAVRAAEFVIPSLIALYLLSKQHPAAADWWFAHVPQSFSPERSFGFAAAVCEEVQDDRPLPDQLNDLLDPDAPPPAESRA